MIYANGDSSLEDYILKNVVDMASVDTPMNVVVQLDRVPGHTDSYDDWTDCRRFRITKGLTPANGNEIMNLGEVNMGNPKTLRDFVDWSIENYPADNYALIISGHGRGWPGTSYDLTSDNDNLNLPELGNALSGLDLDLIGFDSCQMGSIEVAYAIKDYADVMVASEHAVISNGWPYGQILESFNSGNATELGKLIVDKYYESNRYGLPLSLLDLRGIDEIISSIKNSEDVLRSINNTVVYERHGRKWPGSHGLSVYFPTSKVDFNYRYNNFSIETGWSNFLVNYYKTSDLGRSQSQQYFDTNYVDLYDFFSKETSLK
jgi:hypothetical protein